MASVQGAVISHAMLAHWTRIKRVEPQSRAKSTSSSLQPYQKALVFLITAEWLQAEAAAQGIVVSPSETIATYQGLVSGPAGQAFASGLKRRGKSRADELLELRLDNLSQKLEAKIAAGINGVSAAQIAAYYHAHPGQFQGHGHRRQTLAAVTPAIRQTLLEVGRERQALAFAAAYRQRWKLRTTCQSGYVVPECRNGPPLPARRSK